VDLLHSIRQDRQCKVEARSRNNLCCGKAINSKCICACVCVCVCGRVGAWVRECVSVGVRARGCVYGRGRM
jgi:hypothetical protein